MTAKPDLTKRSDARSNDLFHVVPNKGDHTTKRLLAVAQILEERPDLHDQKTWVRDKHGSMSAGGARRLRGRPEALDSCGTTACVAGWAVAMSPRRLLSSDSIPTEASKALGLTGVGGSALFYTMEASSVMVQVLRILAKTPAGERDYVAVLDALHEASKMTQPTSEDVLSKVLD